MPKIPTFLMVLFLCIGCALKQGTVQTELLEGVVPPKTLIACMNVESITVLDIIKKPLEGTEGAYSNKLEMIRTLEAEEVLTFKKLLLNDEAFEWTQIGKEWNFEPTRQFVLKSSQNQVNLVLDERNSLLSIIDLEGQTLLPLKKKGLRFLAKL